MGIIGNDKKIIMKFKIYLTILFFASFFSKAFSQSSFTPEPEKFLKDVQEFIGNYDKSIAKKYVKSFEPLWLGDFFTPDKKAIVYALLNSMEEKKLNVYPDFINYFNAIYNYSNSGMSSEKFEKWNTTLDNVLKKYNNKRVQDFLKVSNKGSISSGNMASSHCLSLFARVGDFPLVDIPIFKLPLVTIPPM